MCEPNDFWGESFYVLVRQRKHYSRKFLGLLLVYAD